LRRGQGGQLETLLQSLKKSSKTGHVASQPEWSKRHPGAKPATPSRCRFFASAKMRCWRQIARNQAAAVSPSSKEKTLCFHGTFLSARKIQRALTHASIALGQVHG
jgi:hypothetical protein